MEIEELKTLKNSIFKAIPSNESNKWNHRPYINSIFSTIEKNQQDADSWFKLFIVVSCGYQLKKISKKIYQIATKTLNVWKKNDPNEKLYLLLAKYLIEK